MKKVLVATLMLIMLSGCVVKRSWTYQSEPKEFKKSETNLRIAVLPMTDRRENQNTNALLMSWIPLFPYGWSDYKTPEGTSLISDMKSSEDFAKAVAQDLNNSNMFKEVFFSYKESDGDYFVVGEINTAQIKEKLFSYGLSIFGSYLWFLGAPAIYQQNNMDITFKILDKNYKEYFRKSYKSNKGEVIWIYETLVGNGHPFKLDILLKDVISQFKIDLHEELPILVKNK